MSTTGDRPRPPWFDSLRLEPLFERVFGNEEQKRAQCREARFVNTTKIVTLLGAAALQTCLQCLGSADTPSFKDRSVVRRLLGRNLRSGPR